MTACHVTSQVNATNDRIEAAVEEIWNDDTLMGEAILECYEEEETVFLAALIDITRNCRDEVADALVSMIDKRVSEKAEAAIERG